MKFLFTFPHGIVSHISSCLIDGLEQLGHEVFRSIPQLPQATPNSITLTIKNSDRAKYDMIAIDASGDIPLRFQSQGYDNIAVLSMNDAVSSQIIDVDDLPFFTTHENSNLTIPGIRVPWAFGMSTKVFNLTGTETAFGERSSKIIRNFTNSQSQGVRDSLDLSLVPILENFLSIDRKPTNHEQFLESLGNSLGCLAYGGNFLTDLSNHPGFLDVGSPICALHERMHFKTTPIIIRWDSWRLWESLAAGCLTLTLDFQKYGFLLPEMPIPYVHYIPIDFADTKESVYKFLTLWPQWREISENGRAWARKHYSPQAMAKKFIETMQDKPWKSR